MVVASKGNEKKKATHVTTCTDLCRAEEKLGISNSSEKGVNSRGANQQLHLKKINC